MSDADSENRMTGVFNNGYAKTAGRLAVWIWVTVVYFLALSAVSMANEEAAAELVREMTVSVGPVAIDILSIPFFLVFIWASAPLALQALDDYKRLNENE